VDIYNISPPKTDWHEMFYLWFFHLRTYLRVSSPK
jgi:hypothetical protein